MNPVVDAGRRAANLILWALGVRAVAGLIHHGVVADVLTELRGGGYADTARVEALVDRMEMIAWLATPVLVATLVGFGVGLLALARTSARGAGRILLAGGVMALVSAVLDAGVMAISLAELEVSFATWKVVSTVSGLAILAALVLAACGMEQLARRAGGPELRRLMLASLPFLVLPGLLEVAWIHGIAPSDAGPWVGFFATTTLGAVGLGVLAVMAARLRSGGGRPERSAAELPERLSKDWSVVADGLKLYGDAITWRLATSVFGYALLVFGVVGESRALMKVSAWILPLVALATGVAMAVGIHRYARQPRYSPAGTAAWVAFGTMMVGIALEVWGLYLVFRMFTAGDGWAAVSEIRELAERAQSASLWAMGLGFAGLVAMLVSFARLAASLGPPGLQARVFGVGSAFVLMAFAVLGTRLYLDGARVGIGAELTAALLVLSFALFTVIAYINLTRAMERAIRDRAIDDTGDAGDAVELPSARIVRD